MKHSLSELKSKMIFQAYSSKNLDAIEVLYKERFSNEPPAFMARSPFGLYGKYSNKKKLVISQKHCAHNAVFVPLKLTKSELEYTIMALGEIRKKVFVDRRKADKEYKLSQAIKENRHRTFSKHCPYCGIQYITQVIKPDPHCGKNKCQSKHQEHLKLQKELRKKSKEKSNIEKVINPRSMPDINLDDPSNSTLQGYVYCIRAENGLCKIGRSSDMSHRFNTVVTMSPISVYLEHTVFSDNYVLAESYTHEVLDQYRHHGEWFDLPNNIFDWFLSLDNYDLDDMPEPPEGVQR